MPIGDLARMTKAQRLRLKRLDTWYNTDSRIRSQIKVTALGTSDPDVKLECWHLLEVVDQRIRWVRSEIAQAEKEILWERMQRHRATEASRTCDLPQTEQEQQEAQ